MTTPSWDLLHEYANGQSGYFTAQQAAEAGFSPQLLHKHIKTGALQRPLRGIYRLGRFPPAEHEELVVLWLWSDRAAVFSHETALQLHELSDALPSRAHLTLPRATPRRRKLPDGMIAHYADLPPADITWNGPIPVTGPARSVLDVAAAHGDANLVAQAIDQGIRRGLFTIEKVAQAASYVAMAQGVGTLIRPHNRDSLGESFYTHGLSGVCSKPPPSDWPTTVVELAQSHGATLRVAQLYPSMTMQLEFAWPLKTGSPSPQTLRELSKSLKRRFAWR
ncbi:MAG: type IV toxin-antitoxin system AbiEi family antitoxin domain-containing protein [Myxococcota bacterium]|nr:type IV toxin-antitoxin system AbiEi family antitoxin domain-containing protein [Myxococcota bacterium]